MRNTTLYVLGLVAVVAVLLFLGYKVVAVSIGLLRVEFDAPERIALPASLQADEHSPLDDLEEYWRNVAKGRLDVAWEGLSPEFRARKHDDRFDDYRAGYDAMQICGVDISDMTVVSLSEESADIMAHLVYYAGSTCATSEYDFEFHLVRDSESGRWLIDGLVSR